MPAGSLKAGLSARRVRENVLSERAERPSRRTTTSPLCTAWPNDGIVVAVANYFVYILRCADGTLYTGSTTDVQAREATHNSGRGAKYTAARRPVRVVYSEQHESRSAAQKREAQLKRHTRAKKEALIAGDSGVPKALSPMS
jgi:putative endonuclease